ncbi:DUF4181 domain-containing protein [Virgibacillus kimchii]
MTNYLLGFILLGLVVTFIADILMRRKHHIDFEFRLYRPVNAAHKWMEITLFILFIIGLTMAAFLLPQKAIYAVLFGFLTIDCGIRAYMEYTYGIKEEKEYMINFIWTIGYGVIFIGTVYFTFINNFFILAAAWL